MNRKFLVSAVAFSTVLASCGGPAVQPRVPAMSEKGAGETVETVDSDIAAIADLQSKHGPEFVTTLDCTKYSEA